MVRSWILGDTQMLHQTSLLWSAWNEFWNEYLLLNLRYDKPMNLSPWNLQQTFYQIFGLKDIIQINRAIRFVADSHLELCICISMVIDITFFTHVKFWHVSLFKFHALIPQALYISSTCTLQGEVPATKEIVMIIFDCFSHFFCSKDAMWCSFIAEQTIMLFHKMLPESW